ncbi:MAG: response regulator [Alphaproteobacteria bacterium]|nr:response regulator [Alphaproteobacteria bacterium]
MALRLEAEGRLSRPGLGALLLGLLVIYVAVPPLAGTDGNFQTWWSNAFWTLASFAAGMRSLLTARRASGSDALAFALIGTGSLNFFVGMLFWSFDELVRGIATPFPGPPDFFFLLAAPIYAAGLYFYRSGAFRLRTSFTQAGNLGLVASALLVVVPAYLHEAVIASDEGALYVLTALGWAGLYLLPAMFGLVMLTVYDWGRRRIVLLALVLAFSAHALVDVLYAYQLLHETFQTGGAIDILWILAFAGEYWAAEEQDRISGEVPAEVERSDRSETLEALLPAILVLAVFGTLIARHVPFDGLITPLLVAASFGFALSLGFRDWWIRRADRELHEAEAAARALAVASERRQRAIFEQSADAILVLDAGGVVQAANRAAARLAGRREDEMPGRAASELFGPGLGWLLSEAEEGNGPLQRETEVRLGDGTALPAEVSLVRLAGADDVAASSVVIRDLRRRREEEMQRQRGQRMQAIGQITGGVAHDFNNLLTVVLGNADMLARELDGQPELRRQAEMIGAAAEHGAKLTRQLLAFARQQPLRPEPVDVNALIEALLEMLRRAVGAAVEVHFTPAPDLPPALIDPTQLQSALLNLAINARDAMPEGGSLSFVTEFVPAGPGGRTFVRVAVSDTGHGMTEEIAARAFEPFFTTKEVGMGSGLGLSMVQGFAEQSGGQASLRTAPGAGTEVSLLLPRAEAGERAGGGPAGEVSAVPRHGARILVVEDDALVREHVGNQLRALGHTVSMAADGGEALRLLRRGIECDLLFTDMVMPGGMDGRQLLAAARAERPRLKVVLTSGHSGPLLAEQGRLVPDAVFLAKPYRVRELTEALERALG